MLTSTRLPGGSLLDPGSVIEGLAGLLIVAATLADVFASVLVPGPAFGGRGVAGLVRTATLPVWRHATRTGGRDRRLSNLFAPTIFLLAFLAWMVLLLLGFGLLFHATADLFRPALVPFSQAVYVAGSSLLTLGVSEVDATGIARWLILASALSGFSIITATITFILQVQSALHEREKGVMTLAGMAGRPGSAVALLETMAELDLTAELPDFFRSWRDWSASVLHSHTAHPVLGYFHSVDQESDWLTALAIVLDAATLIGAATDESARGAATLMHRSGSRTAARLCALYGLKPADRPEPADSSVSAALDRLAAAGFAVRPGEAGRFAAMRADYAPRLDALAAHLGSRRPGLLPGPKDDA